MIRINNLGQHSRHSDNDNWDGLTTDILRKSITNITRQILKWNSHILRQLKYGMSTCPHHVNGTQLTTTAWRGLPKTEDIGQPFWMACAFCMQNEPCH